MPANAALSASVQKPVTPETNYMLHGQTLAVEEASKYLGVTLTSNLSWNKHVENVAAKGNRTLGFVKCNLRECTKPVKAASYTTLVRPVLEYASTIWDPTTDHNIIDPGPSTEEGSKVRDQRLYDKDTWLCDTHARRSGMAHSTKKAARQQALHAIQD